MSLKANSQIKEVLDAIITLKVFDEEQLRESFRKVKATLPSNESGYLLTSSVLTSFVQNAEEQSHNISEIVERVTPQ